MSSSIAVILACIVSAMAALIGVGVQALRHGPRLVWGWLALPLGALLTFAFIPASIGLAEKTWGAASIALWLTLATGTAGIVLQVIGWRAVLRTPLRPTQCPVCEYERGALVRCPECGAGGDE